MSLNFNYSLISSNYNQMTLDWPKKGVVWKDLVMNFNLVRLIC